MLHESAYALFEFRKRTKVKIKKRTRILSPLIILITLPLFGYTENPLKIDNQKTNVFHDDRAAMTALSKEREDIEGQLDKLTGLLMNDNIN